MLSLIENYKKIFSSILLIDETEDFDRYDLEITSTTPLNLDTAILNYAFVLNSPDEISLSIRVNDGDEIYSNNIDEVSKLIEDYNYAIEICDEIQKIYFYIKIIKNTKNLMCSIYSLDSLYKFLDKNISNSLKALKKLKDFHINKFILYCEDNLRYCSDLFHFLSPETLTIDASSDTNCYLEKMKLHCNFVNYKSFDFTPENFKFNGLISNKKLKDLLSKYQLLFILIYIFDTSSIDNDLVTLKLTGYKILNFEINFKTLSSNSISYYYDIFKWVYTEGTVSDKIVLARNILSIYLLNSSSIDIDSSVMKAIESNYRLYLNENVDKYLELKSKIIESIVSENKAITDLISSVYDNFLKNLGAIGTFFITTIIMNSFSEKTFLDIFTKDITLISIALIIISLGFLWLTLKEAKQKRKNIIKIYYRIKLSYNDLLVKNDIENIYKKDRYFKKEIRNLDEKIRTYKNFWIFVVVVFFVLIFILGFQHFYFVFCMIRNFFVNTVLSKLYMLI